MTERPFDWLRVSGERFTNPRTSSGLDDAKIRELAMHIVRYGLLTALLVTKDGLIIGGQRRWRAILTILAWARSLEEHKIDDGELHGDLAESEWPMVIQRANELRAAVPVRILDTKGFGWTEGWIGEKGMALADNVMREDLSSYEIAVDIDSLSSQGVSGVDIARMLGKSTAWVSRKLSTYRGACTELREAWASGALPEVTVQELAVLPAGEQVKAIAGDTRVKRGAVNRPPIDTVKDVLRDIAQRNHERPPKNSSSALYERGAIDALRWVAGQKTSPDFVKLVEPES